ncbi:MAG: tyrosine-type recombinase/integrase [Streptosporangiaceae bacterium]
MSVDAGDRWPQATDAGRLSAWMRGQGFAPGTITEYQRRARLLGAWLSGRQIGPSELTGGIAVEFGAAVRAAGHAGLTVRGAVRLVAYLEESGAISRQEPRAGQIPPREALIGAYRDCLISRQLAAGTITTRLRLASLFLGALDDDCVQAGRVVLPAREVTGILTSWGTLARCRASPLRVFLRFLLMAGYIDEDLAAAVPRVRRSSPARQAARLTGEQAQRLAASLDASGEAGTRDKAVLLLLWRPGLRAGEITRLDLDDIGWRQGTLLVHRKAGRDEELPLPADVGQALADYLVARPRSVSGRAVVLTLTTPRRRLSLHGVVSIVRRLSGAAGTTAGPRQFRHLLGDQLLEAGHGLREIAQVLGHREGDLATTIRYVTPPRQQMAGLVRPWPAEAVP